MYNNGLFLIFKQRVVTLAVLADLRDGWLPDEDRFQLARPQIAGLRTAGDPEGRYRAKWQLVRNLDDIAAHILYRADDGSWKIKIAVLVCMATIAPRESPQTF